MRGSRWQLEPGISWSVLMVYIGLIFYLSSRPSPDLLGGVHVSDKLLHLGEYGLLGFLSQRAAHKSWAGRGRRATAWRVACVWLCGAALAGLDELVQSRVPTRTASVSDLAADWLGLGVGLALNMVVVRGDGLGGTGDGGNDE